MTTIVLVIHLAGASSCTVSVWFVIFEIGFSSKIGDVDLSSLTWPARLPYLVSLRCHHKWWHLISPQTTKMLCNQCLWPIPPSHSFNGWDLVLATDIGIQTSVDIQSDNQNRRVIGKLTFAIAISWSNRSSTHKCSKPYDGVWLISSMGSVEFKWYTHRVV